MMRRIGRLANKRVLFFVLLSASAALLTLQAPKTFSKSPAPCAVNPLEGLPRPADLETGYTLHDGTVVGNGSSTVMVDENGATLPGNVDVLDIDRANDLEQKKGAGKGGGKGGGGKAYKTKVDPVWFANNTRFWYRNDIKEGKEFIVVEVEPGTRRAAFDHEKLAAGLSKATDTVYQGAKLPFQTIEFVEIDKAVRFSVNDKHWQCDLATYECKPSTTGPKGDVEEYIGPPVDEPRDEFHNSYDRLLDDELSPEEREEQKGAQKKGAPQKKGGIGGKGGQPAGKDLKSPDGNWTAFIKERNVWLRDKDGKETKITSNGVEGDAFSSLTWSADSKAVVAYRTTPGDNKTVYRIETSPTNQLYAVLHEKGYPRAMDKMATHEMWLVDIESMKPIKVEIERIDFRGIPRLRWSKDNSHFTFEKTDRGHQRFRVVEVNARNGKTRTLIDEKSDSMVNHYGDGAKNDTFYLQYLDETGEMIYLSEMDGWKHLYLIDAKEGKIKHQMTKGEWVVRKINKLDTKNRQIWFQGSGKNDGQDPYLMHFYRVNFDGTGLVALTEGNGNHSISYSPDGKYIIASYSRVDLPPINELRRVSDGAKMCDLEKADVSTLEAGGWRMPEVFVAKGRDGKTDIWGYVVRPRNYDANKKYPVIENIYAGPHSNHVRKTWSENDGLQSLAEMGYIVVKIDGMGTMNRSKAFHAVCWQNLKDAGFPDRILWMKALAAKYAHVDITRVGIYGTSAGGQNACGAVLLHPEFYKVAVAACGCHDNRLDKSSWNESWMGLMGPHYEASSNITLAKNLQGKLLLIVGEMDTNVPPESTYRVVDALIKARKDFDFIAVPGLGHSGGGPHGERRKNDFFRQHLLGILPPDHNALPGAKKGKDIED